MKTKILELINKKQIQLFFRKTRSDLSGLRTTRSEAEAGDRNRAVAGSRAVQENLKDDVVLLCWGGPKFLKF